MNSWKKYMENEIKTSNPVKITIMAYERCILELRMVKELLEKFRYSEVDKRLIKVEQLIRELSAQLNFDIYPELANDLYDLYEWILQELNVVHMKKEKEKIDPIIVVLQNLLDGYREIVKNEL